MHTPPIIPVKAIVPYSLGKLRSVIDENLGRLIFRRVSTVEAKREHLIETVVTKIVHGAPLPGVPMSIIHRGASPYEHTPKELEQNVEERYSEYSFCTTDIAIRDNDKYGGSFIRGDSSRYSQLDITGPKMDFRFSTDRMMCINPVPPRVGELVCGLVVKDTHKKTRRHSFRFWFTCSEQFLRAWTAIRYATHESLEKLVTRPVDDFRSGIADFETEIRKNLFRSNRLCTNSYRKWILACRDNSLPFDYVEADRRYYTLRTEMLSVNWVHVYAALTLMLRYREIPNITNIPPAIGNPVPRGWDLPPGWIDRFARLYGLFETVELRRIYSLASPPPRRPRIVDAKPVSRTIAPSEAPLVDPSLPSPYKKALLNHQRVNVVVDENLLIELTDDDEEVEEKHEVAEEQVVEVEEKDEKHEDAEEKDEKHEDAEEKDEDEVAEEKDEDAEEKDEKHEDAEEKDEDAEEKDEKHEDAEEKDEKHEDAEEKDEDEVAEEKQVDETDEVIVVAVAPAKRGVGAWADVPVD